MTTPIIRPAMQTFVLPTFLVDVSTSSSAYVVTPIKGHVESVWTVRENAITGADATITVKLADGTSIGTATLANSGSAAGDRDQVTFSVGEHTPNRQLQEGDVLEIHTNGNSSTACQTHVHPSFRQRERKGNALQVETRTISMCR
jgi:hypothetical protein